MSGVKCSRMATAVNDAMIARVNEFTLDNRKISVSTEH